LGKLNNSEKDQWRKYFTAALTGSACSGFSTTNLVMSAKNIADFAIGVDKSMEVDNEEKNTG
jgi:hypothetical protein